MNVPTMLCIVDEESEPAGNYNIRAIAITYTFTQYTHPNLD